MGEKVEYKRLKEMGKFINGLGVEGVSLNLIAVTYDSLADAIKTAIEKIGQMIEAGEASELDDDKATMIEDFYNEAFGGSPEDAKPPEPAEPLDSPEPEEPGEPAGTEEGGEGEDPEEFPPENEDTGGDQPPPESDQGTNDEGGKKAGEEQKAPEGFNPDLSIKTLSFDPFQIGLELSNGERETWKLPDKQTPNEMKAVFKNTLAYAKLKGLLPGEIDLIRELFQEKGYTFR